MGIAAWALVVSIGSAVISLGTVGVTVVLSLRRESYEERLKRERLAMESHARILSSIRELGGAHFGTPERVDQLDSFLVAMRAEIATPYSLVYADKEASGALETLNMMSIRDRETLSRDPDAVDAPHRMAHCKMSESVGRFIAILDNRSRVHFQHLADSD